MSAPEVVIRVYVDGAMTAEDRFSFDDDISKIAEAARRHATLAQEGAYMVEFEFSDGQHIRWGTDPDGMVTPMPVDDLMAALYRQVEEYTP